MIVVMGVAGAGKTMQGTMLAAELGCEWISLGNILRSHITDERREKMLAGELVDDNDTIEILNQALSAIDASKNECILDGCPRTVRQAEWLDEQVKQGRVKVTSVLHIIADKELVKLRLLKRGRQDDYEAAIAERFREYDETIVPIVSFLKSRGYQIQEIDGKGSVEQVHQRVLSAIAS